MKNELLEIACVFVFLVVGISAPIVGLVAADYFMRAESTVNAINAQCGTQYKKLDYLLIGKEAMLAMCETRQKRVEIR